MTMQPGPELDRLVAEKVMGWRVHNRNTAFYVLAGEEDGPMFNLSKHDTCGSLRFAPSTNIAHAWEVVEHIIARGQGLAIYSDNEGWNVYVQISTMTEHRYAIDKRKSLPHAICLAALQACGVDTTKKGKSDG